LPSCRGGAARIGTNIIHRAHPHGTDDAISIEGKGDVEDAVVALHVAAAHVLQTVLEEADRAAQHP
jgi:hypothetical protein